MTFHWKYDITQWPQIDLKSAKNNYLLLLKNMQVTTHLKLAFFQTGEFPGIEKSSLSVYLGMHCTYLHNKQTYSLEFVTD